jgi:hypothetical protein
LLFLLCAAATGAGTGAGCYHFRSPPTLYPRRVAVTYWIVCLRLPDLRSTYNLLIVATAGVLLRSVCPYYYTVPAAAAAACLLAAATNAVLALLTYLLVPNFPPLPSSASHLLPLLFTLHWF